MNCNLFIEFLLLYILSSIILPRAILAFSFLVIFSSSILSFQN
nr:MAG TPA: hypothetical protein [Caudoviricetes sp.]